MQRVEVSTLSTWVAFKVEPSAVVMIEPLEIGNIFLNKEGSEVIWFPHAVSNSQVLPNVAADMAVCEIGTLLDRLEPEGRLSRM